VLADQVKCVDWRARKAEFAGKAPASAISEVIAKLSTLIQ
jgi:mRNA interferase MazF